MGVFDRISNLLNTLTRYSAAILLGAMTLLVFLQVLFRYVLNHPLDWSEELASFAFVWMALLGASIGLKRKEHPRLDLIVNLFPRKVRRIVTGLYNITILLMLLVLFIYGWKLTAAMTSQLTAALQYSVSYVYAVLPISAAIMFVHLSVQTLNLFLGRDWEETN